jgi:hypothetical protein
MQATVADHREPNHHNIVWHTRYEQAAYAVKKKRDAGKAQAERDEVKTGAQIQAQVAAAIEAAKITTAPTTADSPAG